MKIFVYENMHSAGMDILHNTGEVVMASAHDEETIIKEAAGAQAVIIRAFGKVSKGVIDSLPDLKVIGKHGVGVDNIDVDYAKEKGVPVVYTPLAPSNATAEHAVSLLFSLSRKVPQFHQSTTGGNWNFRHSQVTHELVGKTLGIIGMGRIGKRVAEMASLGIRMNVLYHDVQRNTDAESKYNISYASSIEELLPQCDYVTIHVPSLPQTQKLMNRDRFALMKPTAYLINTARGAVVDTVALVEALQQGKLAGAGLDVFDPEPIPNDHALLTMPQVVVTPHVGGISDQSLINMSLVAKDIAAVLEGRTPEYLYS